MVNGVQLKSDENYDSLTAVFFLSPSDNLRPTVLNAIWHCFSAKAVGLLFLLLIALFTIGFVIEMIYKIGGKFFGGYGIYYRAWYLFAVIPSVYFSGGFDHSFNTILVLLLQVVVMVITLSVITRLYAKIKRLSWRPA